MKYWVVSANVDNSQKTLEEWISYIRAKKIAVMGWNDQKWHGKTFKDKICIGDIIIVAQGSNVNKRLCLAGIVTSEALAGKLENPPGQYDFYRDLSPAIELTDDPTTYGLSFKGAAFGESQRLPSLYQLYPERNEADRLIVAKMHELLNLPLELNDETDGDEIVNLIDFTIEECSQATGFPVNQVATWLAAIERKKQAVFYGPPGTGKTFVSHLVARHIVGGGDGFIERIQFHPAWTYEDFMQGIRPETDQKGNLHFELKAGRFVEFCTRARQRRDVCVLIIDELNRANIARVFGELMYLLEYREQDMPLSGGLRFSIPDNVRIVGTMNTADRSIALVDFALRRRFAFIELLPEYSILHAFQATRSVDAGGLIAVLKEVNAKIDDKNFHLGISFFMVEKLVEKLEEIWRMEIETYLEEYFFSQPSTVSGYRWDKIKDRLFA
jgi:hypothetical protein